MPDTSAPRRLALLALLASGCVGSIAGNDSSGDEPTIDGGGDSIVDGGGFIPSDANLDEGVRAFPGAQGFGAYATGGRGGEVIKVTTLAATGAGSLQAALDRSGPRIIVFAVSGVIDGDIEVTHGDVTIAGQSAPGGGITIRGRLTGAYDFAVGNIVIRHLRIRPAYDGSAGEQFDSIQFSRNHLLMLDHLSVSFGVDETVDLYEAEDVTVQWSAIEMSATSGHPEGEHNYGLINGPNGHRTSIHHTLFAHHKNRCPAIANGPADVRNNVIYNVRHGFVHHNPASGAFNIIGNYYRAGGDDTLYPFYFDDEDPSADEPTYFMADNYVDDPSSACAGVVSNPWSECEQNLGVDASHRVTSEHDFSSASYFAPIETQSSTVAYDLVLDQAGAFPRDVVTSRAVAETRARSGAWGAIMPADLMAGLSANTPAPDSDDDGMPDEWELSNGLDPGDDDDHATLMPSGYTAIEDYLNAAAEQVLP